LADACVFRLFYLAPDEQKQLEERANAPLETVHSLDPDLAEAYVVRGKLLWTRSNHFPHERVILEYRRALDLNPNLEEALSQLALVHSHIGLFEEALRGYQKLAAINPNSPPLVGIGNTLLWRGNMSKRSPTGSAYSGAVSVLTSGRKRRGLYSSYEGGTRSRQSWRSL
jgi:tetratricopeptide (TPR) repeat protein